MNVRATDLTALSVADIDRAATFYRDLLGLDITPGDAGHPMRAMWRELDTSPVTIALSLDAEDAGENGGIALAVPDVPSAVSEVRGAGHRVVTDVFDTPLCHIHHRGYRWQHPFLPSPQGRHRTVAKWAWPSC